jgi:hypothetical protein
MQTEAVRPSGCTRAGGRNSVDWAGPAAKGDIMRLRPLASHRAQDMRAAGALGSGSMEPVLLIEGNIMGDVVAKSTLKSKLALLRDQIDTLSFSRCKFRRTYRFL